MKKEHFEILLERMDSKFDLVMESHAALDKKIDKVQSSLEEKIEKLQWENKEEHRLLQHMISDVNNKLDANQKETTDLKRRVSRLEAA